MWALVHFIAFIFTVSAGLYFIAKVIYHRYCYIRLGKPVHFRKDMGERLTGFISQVFGQKKLLKDKKSGIMHILMFYGFIILQFGAIDIIFKGLAGRGLPIPGYEYFILSQEMTVFLILLATGYAGYRRYIEKLPRLKKGFKAGAVIIFIFSLMLSVLLTMGFERMMAGEEPSLLAPISSLIAILLGGLPETAQAVGYYTFWWSHLLILLSFALYVPQSKHFHLMVAPINILLRRTGAPGKLDAVDFEDETQQSYGVGAIEDFTQKQMLDFYACVECGRCTSMCPASNTGKFLSPMHLITKMRDHLTEKGAAVTSKAPWQPAFLSDNRGVHAVDHQAAADAGADGAAFASVTDIRPTLGLQKKTWAKTDRAVEDVNLIGDVITEEEIWACTTCRNCEDQCPVSNEHVDKIVDLRRHLVMMQGRVPQAGQRAIQNIERQGNPWGINRNDRSKWMQDLTDWKVPTVQENPDFEYLFFVGTMGSYDKRSNKIVQSFVYLLHEAKVNFAVLGNEEKNSGDTPRRMGNEFLFQQLCSENIALFNQYHVKKIVTACPHTFNIFKNEYPEYGLQAEVLHHTQLLEQLLREGRLVPRRPVQERITYHDSCYLGRYNGVYDAPRSVLKAIPGVELVEMERNRENGMCCGAGGGNMWMEEDRGKRVNVARTEQALAVQPTMISSACPYCLTMLEDGTKMKGVEEKIRTRDIAEILAESV